jgi:type II secretory pathway pseudopilin PulG
MRSPPTLSRKRLRQAGFYYAEALVSTVIVGVCLAPAVSALHSALDAPAVEVGIVNGRQHLQGKLEQVLAQPITDLDAAATAAGNPSTPSSYSDPVGTSDRVLVYLSRYDGDNADGDNNPFTGTDSSLLWVRVQTASGTQSLTALATP